MKVVAIGGSVTAMGGLGCAAMLCRIDRTLLVLPPPAARHALLHSTLVPLALLVAAAQARATLPASRRLSAPTSPPGKRWRQAAGPQPAATAAVGRPAGRGGRAMQPALEASGHCRCTGPAPHQHTRPPLPSPGSNITFANKGMGAWNSERFEPCIARIVPEVGALELGRRLLCWAAGGWGGAVDRCERWAAPACPAFLKQLKQPSLPSPGCCRTRTWWWCAGGRELPSRGAVEGCTRAARVGEHSVGESHPRPATSLYMQTARPRLQPTHPQVEFAINDMVPSQPWLLYNSSERRAYEGIVRHLLRMPRAPALLLLHVYPFNQAGGDGVTEGLFYREPEGQLTVLAHVRARMGGARLAAGEGVCRVL